MLELAVANEIIIGKVNTLLEVLNNIPEVCYVGNPILRNPAEEVIHEEGIKIGEQLAKTLMKYRSIAGYGRGLAAPQIGINKSVFITFVDDEIDIFMNPKIVTHSDTNNYYRELCLSSGILSADVARPNWIVMSFVDKNGAVREEKFDGFKARLYQHEEDHLRGILNLDICEHGGIEIINFDPLQEKLRDTR